MDDFQMPELPPLAISGNDFYQALMWSQLECVGLLRTILEMLVNDRAEHSSEDHGKEDQQFDEISKYAHERFLYFYQHACTLLYSKFGK